MSKLDRHKKRLDRLKKIRSTSHVKEIASPDVSIKFMSEEVDSSFHDRMSISKAYSAQIDSFDLYVPPHEVQNFIDTINKDVAAESIVAPVFLSLLDGMIRAFNLGSKQGLTATRLYEECASFRYQEHSSTKTQVDSYTESINERRNSEQFGEKSKFAGGELHREGEAKLNLRDSVKMKAVKEQSIGGDGKGIDDYNSDEVIYGNKKHARSAGKSEQAAETDHVISCHEIANQLKSNKALNPNDIKEIINLDENLAVTSKKNNRGSDVGKFAKNKQELQQELEQGFAEDKNGQRTELSDADKKARSTMIEKIEEAEKAIENNVNQKVMDNILNDRKSQQRLAEDAAKSGANLAVGEMIIFIIKPLYFELNDSFRNGIEEGVDETGFKGALKKRFGRMKAFLMNHASETLKDGGLNFFKNFLSMLLEGIVNCFVGVFKNVARIMKEGVKALFQIIPILKNKDSTMAEKGDAITKLLAASVVTFSSIGIETWLNSLGIGEPLSIVMSSVLSAVIMSLVMYILNKIDLFGVNKELKYQRISELLDSKKEETRQELNNILLSIQ